MRNFEQSLERFLGLVKDNTGRSPQFSLDYNKGEILIVDATSGFLKRLYSDDKVCASLGEKGITVVYFAD